MEKLIPYYCNLTKNCKKILFLVVTGLYNLAPLQKIEDFPFPKLPSIRELFFDYLSVFRKNVKEIRHQILQEFLLKGWKFQWYVKNRLDPNVVVVMVPPLPGLITQCGSEDLEKEECLIESYKEFCTVWTSMCCDMFTLHGLDSNIFKSYIESCDEFVSVMNPSAGIQDITRKLNDWFEMIKLLLQSKYHRHLPIYCNNFRRNLKCGNVTETKECPYSHRCEICNQGDHGRASCCILDNFICLKYNWNTCNDVFCSLKHLCLVCGRNHLVLNCEVHFMQLLSTSQMTQDSTSCKTKYKRVVLVGNQVALRPFVSSRIPELKKITDIKQLVVDVNLNCHESSMRALYAVQSHMVKHPEFTSDTLWILIVDMSNWLDSCSLCSPHFLDKNDLCTEEIKMLKVKDDLPTRFYKAEQFAKSTFTYIGKKSAFILTPFIGQTVLCPPPDICPSEQSCLTLGPQEVEKFDLSEFHNLVHKSPALKKLQIYSPSINKDVLSKHLAAFEECWLDSVKNIMNMQNIPLVVYDKYVFIKYLYNKKDTFKVLENIHEYCGPNTGYYYWDAFMVTLIKYLCDPKFDEVELMCDFDKVFINSNKDGRKFEEKNKIVKSLMDSSHSEISLAKSIDEEKSIETSEKKYPEDSTYLWLQKILETQKMHFKIKKIKGMHHEVLHTDTSKQSEGLHNLEKSEREPESQQNVFSSESQNSKSSVLDIKEDELILLSSSVFKDSTDVWLQMILESFNEAKKKIFVYNLPQ
ncbi:unnamed protein product, partial [Meganyctiphanes norvegica]